METPTFRTKREAIEAGYRLAKRGVHKDVSGGNSFGYEFEDADGNRTVTVRLTEERNMIGRPGAYVPMFPPTD